MLVVRVYVNDAPIDTIHVWNTGSTRRDGRHVYRIVRPEDPNPIFHRRDDGHRPLLAKVFERLMEKHS